MTLKKTNDWTRMLIAEQRRRNRFWDHDHPIPLDMIHEMLREDPKDRPTAREIWLRFPKCPCCSDPQATKHWPSPSQNSIYDQALCPTSTTSPAENLFATHISNWTAARSPLISDSHSAAPDRPTSRPEQRSNKRRLNKRRSDKWRHYLDT